MFMRVRIRPMPKRLLYSLLSRDEGCVSHLLLDSSTRPAALIEMRDGVERTIATGTEHDMHEKAVEHVVTGKFQVRKDGYAPFYEPLKNAVALAVACGHKSVYVQRRTGGITLPSEYPLSQWRGLTGTNGAPYEYGFDGTSIHARPKLPPDSVNLHPADAKEALQVMLKAGQIRDSLGPSVSVLLGGSDY